MKHNINKTKQRVASEKKETSQSSNWSFKVIYKTTPKHNMVKVDSTINSLSTTKAIFNRVCQRYDINIVNIKEQNGTLYFDIQAHKLDSALMLLPYYRHKLKYDSKKKVWKIR